MLGITPEEVGKLYNQALKVMKNALSSETDEEDYR